MRAALLVAGLLLAGCAAPQDESPESSASTSPAAGIEWRTLLVHVVAETEDGEPVAGAQVNATAGDLTILALTGSEGIASLQVPRANLTVNVSSVGWTNETVSASPEEASVTVPLFQEGLKVSWDLTLPPGAALDGIYWERFPLLLRDGEAVDSGYWARLKFLRGNLTWDNEPTAFAVLDFTVWADGGGHGVGSEPEATPTSSNNLQYVELEGSSAREFGSRASMGPQEYWITSKTGVFGATGVVVHVEFTATFGSPGP